jgi:GNAT superfamily N-acetyltransferase
VIFKRISYRGKTIHSDTESIQKIVRSSGFFSPEEVEMARELVLVNLSEGESSGYFFLFVEIDAVLQEYRGRGIGRDLLERTEEKIGEMGGKRIYVDTSSRDQYEPTRSFYRINGYQQEAFLKDFYAPGDDKIIYVKQL